MVMRILKMMMMLIEIMMMIMMMYIYIYIYIGVRMRLEDKEARFREVNSVTQLELRFREVIALCATVSIINLSTVNGRDASDSSTICESYEDECRSM
jgi:biopolymer transport protein ExbB/TolQ